MTYVYLDWNVFDRIEKKDCLDKPLHTLYNELEEMISEKKIVCPYSNAHINDLLRGHSKNPSYIINHLNTLERLTSNLCLVQYWGDTQVTWHYRDVNEFFNSALNDKDISIHSLSELLDDDETGHFQKLLDDFRLMPVPQNWNDIYDLDPIFNLIFPRTKAEHNMLALCEDINSFSNNVKKDFSLYKSLRRFVNQSWAKLKNQQKILGDLDKKITKLPSYLNYDESWQKYHPKTKTSENSEYQKIIETYCKIDFSGYKSDDKFPNLIDDSLHVFYGAHCDYFITIDDKCHYKAAETYHKLGILTLAMKPNDFIKFIKTRQL
jgi:hypothetical protein